MARRIFDDGDKLFSRAAGDWKTVVDPIFDMRKDERERTQRWSEAEAQRRHAEALNASTSDQDYEAWTHKAGGIIDELYDRAYKGLLNLNLHPLAPPRDTVLCRVCMQIDTGYQYYTSGMSMVF